MLVFRKKACFSIPGLSNCFFLSSETGILGKQKRKEFLASLLGATASGEEAV